MKRSGQKSVYAKNSHKIFYIMEQNARFFLSLSISRFFSILFRLLENVFHKN